MGEILEGNRNIFNVISSSYFSETMSPEQERNLHPKELTMNFAALSSWLSRLPDKAEILYQYQKSSRTQTDIQLSLKQLWKEKKLFDERFELYFTEFFLKNLTKVSNSCRQFSDDSEQGRLGNYYGQNLQTPTSCVPLSPFQLGGEGGKPGGEGGKPGGEGGKPSTEGGVRPCLHFGEGI